MSGGHFDYRQIQMWSMAEEIKELVESNDDQTLDEFGYPRGRGYSSETIEKFKEAYNLTVKAYIYAQRIDWLVSGDDGEDDFHKRLKEDLDEESLYSPSV